MQGLFFEIAKTDKIEKPVYLTKRPRENLGKSYLGLIFAF